MIFARRHPCKKLKESEECLPQESRHSSFFCITDLKETVGETVIFLDNSGKTYYNSINSNFK